MGDLAQVRGTSPNVRTVPRSPAVRNPAGSTYSGVPDRSFVLNPMFEDVESVVKHKSLGIRSPDKVSLCVSNAP